LKVLDPDLVKGPWTKEEDEKVSGVMAAILQSQGPHKLLEFGTLKFKYRNTLKIRHFLKLK
jgi:hypothetical protein